MADLVWALQPRGRGILGCIGASEGFRDLGDLSYEDGVGYASPERCPESLDQYTVHGTRRVGRLDESGIARPPFAVRRSTVWNCWAITRDARLLTELLRRSCR